MKYGEAKEYPKNSGIRYRLRLDTNNYEVSAGVRITGRRYRYSTGLDTLKKAKAHCLEVSKMSRNTDEDFRAHDKAKKVAFNKIGLTATKRGLSTRQLEELSSRIIDEIKPEVELKLLSEVIEDLKADKDLCYENNAIKIRSLKMFKHNYNNVLKEFGDCYVSKITKQKITDWLSTLSFAPKTKDIRYHCLREILNHAIDRGLINENPCKLTKGEYAKYIGKTIWKEPKILSLKQAKMMLEFARDNPKYNLLPFLVLGLYSGIRHEEIQKIEWKQICLVDEKVSITGYYAKGRKNRTIDLPKCAVEWLRIAPHPSKAFYNIIEGEKKLGHWVSKNQYTKQHSKNWMKFWRDCLKANDFPYVSWGDNYENALRHSFSSYYHTYSGYNTQATINILGHDPRNSNLLFAHYKAITSKSDAKEYFEIYP